MKFEYRIVDLRLSEARPGHVEAELNRLGSEGWELVASCGAYSQTLIFMRPLGEPPGKRKTRGTAE